MGEMETRVRLVPTPDGQTLNIPRAFALRTQEVMLRMEGDRLVVEPFVKQSLLAVLAELDDLEDDWPTIEDPPPRTVRL